jgi:protein tyrosine/serine phosphatase
MLRHQLMTVIVTLAVLFAACVTSLQLQQKIAIGRFAGYSTMRPHCASTTSTRKHMRKAQIRMESTSTPTRGGAKEVNIPMECVKNMRDVSTASSQVSIKPTKLFRTGCVSKASSVDTTCIRDKLGIKVLIDLRSPAEVEEDVNIHGDVYQGFQTLNFDKKSSLFVADKNSQSVDGKRRYFISLMSESLIKKGVFLRLRKRRRFQAVLLFLLANFSRRADKKVRSIFLDYINTGGLSLLNELVVDYSGIEIIEVMKIIASADNHPLAMYCTAGKDRTGLIAMLTLSVLGATDEDILTDYVLSDAAYSELNDKKAMVAALKQSDVDPEIFLRAKPQTMKDTMQYIRSEFGSINGFLDKYGFDEVWRERLRSSLKLVK